MSKNIVSVYCLIRFLLGLSMSFFFPIYTIFLLDAGLDLLQVNMVNTCYMAASIAFEVPTGSVADVFGRKVSFVLSCLFLCASFLIYYYSDTFAFFILAETIGAVGSTLYSGAFKSWMIDEIHHTGESFDLTRAYRNGSIWGAIGVSLGSIIGAHLGKIDLALPWIASAILVLITGIVGIFIIKENRPRNERKHPGFSDVWRSIITGYRECKNSEGIRFAIATGCILGFASAPLNMYWQPMYHDMGLETGSLGWLHAGNMAFIIAGVSLSKLVYDSFRDGRKSLLFTLFIFGVGVFFSALSGTLFISLPMFYIHELARGLYDPLLDHHLNASIENGSRRATIQSFQSMVATAGMASGLCISGVLAKNISIRSSWILSALSILVFLAFCLKKRRKNVPRK